MKGPSGTTEPRVTVGSVDTDLCCQVGAGNFGTSPNPIPLIQGQESTEVQALQRDLAL